MLAAVAGKGTVADERSREHANSRQRAEKRRDHGRMKTCQIAACMTSSRRSGAMASGRGRWKVDSLPSLKRDEGASGIREGCARRSLQPGRASGRLSFIFPLSALPCHLSIQLRIQIQICEAVARSQSPKTSFCALTCSGGLYLICPEHHRVSCMQTRMCEMAALCSGWVHVTTGRLSRDINHPLDVSRQRR